MSVSEQELMSIGLQIKICRRRVKELEEGIDRRFSTKISDELRDARANLRRLNRELKRLKSEGQLTLFGGAL